MEPRNVAHGIKKLVCDVFTSYAQNVVVSGVIEHMQVDTGLYMVDKVGVGKNE